MSKSNIVVTGGAGYIGSHICKALRESGFAPVTFDNLSTGNRGAVKWGPLETTDICDRGKVKSLLRHYQPAGIIHLAARSIVVESFQQADQYHRTNVEGMASILDGAACLGKVPVVFSSTCSVYGNQGDRPISETAPTAPQNPYARTKLEGEVLLQKFEAEGQGKTAALRYFNVAGADPEGDIGEDHRPETHLVPLVLQAALEPKLSVSIFGTDYPTGDGTAIRDYIHVTDVARAHIIALTKLLGDQPIGIVNLGGGAVASVSEVVSAARQITGKPIQTHHFARRQGDTHFLAASSERASKVLNFTPKLSSLEQIICSAWEWQKALNQNRTFAS